MTEDMTTELVARLLARSNHSKGLAPAAAEAGLVIADYMTGVEPMTWEYPNNNTVGAAELMSCYAEAADGENLVRYTLNEVPSGGYFITCARTRPSLQEEIVFQAMPGSSDLTRVLMDLHQHFLVSGIEMSRFRNACDDRHPEERFPQGWGPTSLFTATGTVWEDPVRGYTLVLTGGYDEFELRDPDGKPIGQFGEPVEAEIYATAHGEALALRMMPAPVP
jgi:hypothetical protein